MEIFNLCLSKPYFPLRLVIIHEIGQLLLGLGHSNTGIMQSQLEPEEWRRASQGMLRFTPEQPQLIKSGTQGK